MGLSEVLTRGLYDRRREKHQPLAYLDVSHLAGRGEEAAEAILHQVIKPAWKTQGLS